KIALGTPCTADVQVHPHHPGHQQSQAVRRYLGFGAMRVLLPLLVALSVFACSREPQTGVHAAFKACSKGVPANFDNDQRAVLIERCMLSRGYTIAIRAQ